MNCRRFGLLWFTFILVAVVVFSARATTIVNGSFESPAGFSYQKTPGWSGDDQPGHHNAWGTLTQGQFGAPKARAGRQWAFISSDGFKDPVSMWTVVGVVEEDKEYSIGFLAGKCDTHEYKPRHHFEVGIWAGDSERPKNKLASKSFDDPGWGQVEEHTVKLNTGTGQGGEVLYLVFSKPYEKEWSQILIDSVEDISPEAIAERQARAAREEARIQAVIESVLRNPQGRIVREIDVESVEVDWLVKPVTRPVELLLYPGKDKTKPTLILTNGLISRTFRLLPNAATVGFDNLMTSESVLRAVKPEATVKIDGAEYEVGGLKGQVEQAYLRPEWVDDMKSNPDAFQFAGYSTNKIKARLSWKRNRYSADLPWPPAGLELVINYEPPVSIVDGCNGLKVSVHYEMYQGIPVLSKRIVLHNGSDRTVRLNRFVSEILAVVEYEVPEELKAPDPWHPVNVHVESDYSFLSNTQLTTHWVPDPTYTTQLKPGSYAPNIMKSHLPFGPEVDIKPGGTFESFRTFELIYDSTERERKSLSLRRMYRTLAPWVTENPIFWHAASSEPDYIRRAIDQSAEVGFEMLIMTFGSGLNMHSDDPAYLAKYKELADYAHSKGIQLGGYSLLSSTNPGPDYDVVMPTRAQLDKVVYSEFPHEPFIKQWLKSPEAEPRTMFGHSPCLCSKWSDRYFGRMKNFIEKTGFDLLEHDGSYPGNVCASTKHNGHKGLVDSQWLQRENLADFYSWCRDRGIYVNDPDWYMLSGANKTDMTYKERNNSLPRERQIILFRQNIYDGTWNKTPSMGWMFVPLMQYHGGGASATIEPLHEHLDFYEWHLAQNFGSGVQACYRGPRLYDTEETKAVVKKWVDFYKKYRAILDSDIIHVRRPDGRDIDCILHANPQLKPRGLAMLYNPTPRRIKKELKLPLYYTGLTETAMIRREEGKAAKYTLDRQHNVKIPIDMQPVSYTWLVVE